MAFDHHYPYNPGRPFSRAASPPPRAYSPPPSAASVVYICPSYQRLPFSKAAVVIPPGSHFPPSDTDPTSGLFSGNSRRPAQHVSMPSTSGPLLKQQLHYRLIRAFHGRYTAVPPSPSSVATYVESPSDSKSTETHPSISLLCT
jgi:hypothetical protein